VATEPPSPIITDSHTHVVCDDTERFPLRPARVGSDWYLTGDLDVDSLLNLLDANGVDRAVVVQAVGPYGFDCSCAVNAVGAHPSRLSLVGSVDMDVADPAAALDAMAASAPLAGVRLFGVFGEAPVWLTDSRAGEVWEVARRTGVTIVLTVFASSVPQIADVVAAHPDVPVAIDHSAFADFTEGPPYRAAAPLLELSSLRAVHLKVTPHNLAEAGPDEDPAQLVDALASAFGAERLAWGSDHPQYGESTYAEKLTQARRACRNLSAADQAAFLGGTAERLWFTTAAG
jgi:predicted TIM-barrel fold metal-dependent hydrolase